MRIVTLLSLLFVASPSPAQEAPSDWRGFRGPGGLGRSPDRGLPARWTADDQLWKTELPGPGTSTPIIVGQRVFVTCYSGYNVPGQPRGKQEDLKRHIVALDKDNGKILWTRDFAPKLPEQDVIRDGHGYASSSPAADEKRVFAYFGKSGVVALDHEGKQLWRAEVGERLNGWGSGASLVLDDDTLFVNASVESEQLVALEAASGKVLWKKTGIKDSWNTPIVVRHGQASELVLAIFGKILGINPKTGEELWHCATDIPWYMVPSLVAHNDVVYALGGRPGGGLAVRIGGSGDVTKTHRLWTSKKGSNVSSPIYHDGHLYWMHDNQGTAFCAEASTGKVVYEERIDRAGQVYGSPVLADGKIYYPGRDGATYVVAAKPSFELLAKNSFAERGSYNASPAIAGGRIYLRTDSFITCIGKK